MRRILLFITAILLSQFAWSQIDSATYDASTGQFIIHGSGFNTNRDIYPNLITVRGLNSVSYTFTTGVQTNATTGSTATIALSGIDRAYMNALIDQDGETDSNTDYYKFYVIDGWYNGSNNESASDTIIVSNYAPPSIASATYDVATGILVVSGDRFASNVSANDDVDVSRVRIVGEGGTEEAISSSSDVEVTSYNEFSVILDNTDKSNIDAILNKNGTKSIDNTDYDIYATEDWNKASNGTDADTGPNAITVSNVPIIVNLTANKDEICVGDYVEMSVSPTGGNGIFTYSWDNGSGEFSTSASVKVYPTSNTTYTVTVTSGAENENADTVVIVNGLPSLTSSVVTNPICSGTEFTYVPTSNENVINYSWSRSDTPGIVEGASSSTGNIVETLTNAINDQVSVTYKYIMTTDKGCVDSSNVNVDVNPLGSVDNLNDVLACDGASVSEITFNSSNVNGTNNFNWVSDNTNVGIAVSGSTSIPAFTANTSGTEPEIANITVTPIYEKDLKSCSGPSELFTITVNPAGQVNIINDQEVCNGSNTTYVDFNTVNTVGTTAFDWTNTEAGINLAVSGSGNITSFSATNAGTSPLTGTIEVTPTFTYKTQSCAGSSKTFDITVNPTAQVDEINDEKVCAGDNVLDINFTTANSGGITTYEWTNDNTSINLGASGTNNITSFTSTNATGQPQIANIEVTPSFTYATETCTGPVETFSIFVNPNGQVNTLSDQLLCEGDQTDYVNFVTSNTIGTTIFDWTNDNTSIGLDPSGSDDIPSFTLMNGGNSPITANLQVTPEFSYNGKACAGPPKSFSITANPIAQVNNISDTVFCNGEATGDIVFTSSNSGGTTTYNWTNTNTSIGLVASGSGNILSFNAVNTGTSPVTATITVTPSFDNGGEVCTGPVESFTITVNPSAQVNPVDNFAECKDQRFDDITFSTTNVIGVTTYYWTNSNTLIGLGANGNTNISGFKATNATQTPIVSNVIVTPTFTYAGKACSGTSESFQITVNPTPIVGFTMPQTTYSNDAPADTIRGAIPYGGTFYGAGVIAVDSTFHPTSAGIGSHTISYSAFNGYGCGDTATAIVDVVPPGGSIIGLEAYYCDYAPKDTIRGRPDTGGTLDSAGCGFTPMTGLTIINDSVAVIDPSQITEPTVQIKFTYYKGTPFDVINTTTINQVTGTADFDGLSTGYCEDADVVTLVGSPGSGTFFGNGITGNEFNPGNAELGNNDIGYTYTYGVTGCKDTIVKSTVIFELPTASFEADSLYCSNISPVQFIGEPPTGSFTGPNLSGNDTVLFSPNSSIVGPNIITYTYTDGNGCSDTYEKEIRVTQVATVGIQPINDNYCVNADSVQLKGEVLGVHQPVGDFSGIGVNNNTADDGIGFFRPDIAGEGGPYEVTYTYTDDNSCVSTFSRNIVVRELPNVSINNLNDLYCVNSPAASISGVPAAATGSFNYSGNITNLNDLNDGTALFTPTEITASDTITYTYTDAYGCTNSYWQELEVVDLPDVSFDSDSLFCPNGSAVQIIGVPSGGFFTGPNIAGSDTITFSPSESIIGTHNMIYTYTDTNLCTNSFTREIEVQELPTVGIVNLADSYCVNGDSALLTATANGSPSFEGTFSGPGIFDEVADDGQAYFVPSDAGVGGPYTIDYQFESLNNCIAIANDVVLVRDLPTVSISSPSNLYCESGDMTIITGIPQSSNGEFSYSGVISNLIDVGNGTAEFYPNNVIDTGIITYTYVDQYGCENSFNDSVKVSALPDVGFSMSSNCMGDTIQFVNETVSPEPIASWAWDFGDPTSGNNSSNDENPEHFYASGGNKTINLTANTIDGCSDFNTLDVELGDAPIVDFSWENECYGFSPTIFVNESDDTTTVYWDFGDGNTSTDANPNHMFASVSSFDVTMEVTNQFGCSSEITKSVSIRPFIDSYPYLNDFEAIDQSWVVDIDSENSSWEVGVPDGTIINSAFSGQNSWVTGLVNSYENNEKSSVVSPCYDFSQIDKPMIKMQIWNSTQANADGAVLQAKVDGETNWFNVGDLNDVINWYNGVGLQGNPGGSQNVGSYGWTGIENQWEEVRHELDELKGKTNVRFRISFGSDASGTSDGFAFDDIWIGERTKRVLAESFTNSADNGSAMVNPDFNELMINNASDIVDIQYHTGFPGSDPFNTDNPADVAARTTYYGLSQVPWTIFDGNVYSGSTNQAINNYKLVEEQSLKDPVFGITLESAANSSEINVNIDVVANEELTGKNLTLHTVMIESEVTSITGSNGETQFFSVLRKMLPNAGGTGLNGTWTQGQTESFNFSWDFANAIDPEKVNVVVFIQDEDNQKVYQVATDDTATSMTWLPEIVLSFGNDPFIVYPNPTKGMINLLFDEPTQNDCWANVYDMTGALITQQKLVDGLNNAELNMNYLQQGIYLIKIFNQDGPLGTKRFIKQ
ncbi:MAG: hypothetical protein C0599_13860 [Salinivirgaceae bacterium]|nr:MAG: hypothetical protein C0599_13860 [Salinivirgaceae bacterium]